MTDYISKYSVYIKFENQEVHINTTEISILYFIEDIFSYSVVGQFEFHDRQGIMEFGPLTGNEKIGIVYGVENDIERTFDIYKIDKLMPSWSNANGKENHISITFVDEMFYSLVGKQYSLSWKNKRASEIIKDISENILGNPKFHNWEDSIDILDYFYIPYWNPKMAIDWLTKRSRGTRSRKAGYLFYNDINGSNFYTIESLFMQKRLMDIGWNRSGFYLFEGETKHPYNRILGYEMSGIDNLSKREIKGSTLQGYDFDHKELLSNSYNYRNGIENFTLLGEKSLFPDISDSGFSHQLTGENNSRTMDNMYYDDWIKTYSMQQTLSIVVHGHEARYPGSLVEIEWPSSHKKEIYNKNFAGKYLVKSITHQFGQGRPFYRQKMILMKNAYEGSDNTDLIKSENSNLGVYQYD